MTLRGRGRNRDIGGSCFLLFATFAGQSARARRGKKEKGRWLYPCSALLSFFFSWIGSPAPPRAFPLGPLSSTNPSLPLLPIRSTPCQPPASPPPVCFFPHVIFFISEPPPAPFLSPTPTPPPRQGGGERIALKSCFDILIGLRKSACELRENGDWLHHCSVLLSL